MGGRRRIAGNSSVEPLPFDQWLEAKRQSLIEDVRKNGFVKARFGLRTPYLCKATFVNDGGCVGCEYIARIRMDFQSSVVENAIDVYRSDYSGNDPEEFMTVWSLDIQYTQSCCNIVNIAGELHARIRQFSRSFGLRMSYGPKFLTGEFFDHNLVIR